MLGQNSFGPFSFENEAKRNSDVIVEVFHLLLEFVVSLGQFCNEKLHHGAAVEFLDSPGVGFVDSKKIKVVIKVLVKLVKELVVKDEAVVESIPIFCEVFDNNIYNFLIRADL